MSIVGLGLGITASANFEVVAEAEVTRRKVGIIANGNAQVDTARSKFGGASALFDGTGDYITTSNDTQSEIGTGACTWECFFNVDTDTGSSSSTIISNRTGSYSTGEVQMLFRNSDLKVQVNGNGTGAFSANGVGSALALDTWHHFAWARDASGNWAVFVNGSRVANGTGYTQELAAQGIGIGGMLDGTLPFNATGNGWIDEVRISNTDRYGVGNTTYTVPTSAFRNDDNTKLLLHMNGTDASTFFEDDNGDHGTNRTAVSVVSNGGAQVDSAQRYFDTGSALFDGTDDYLQADSLGSIAGSGEDFTIEGYFRWASTTGGQGLMSDRPPTSSGYTTNNFYLEKNSSNTLFFGFSGGGDITGTSSVTTSTWYHIAVVRNSGTTSLYLNGTQTGSTLSYTGAVGDGTFSIGAVVGQYMNGHIDEVRVSDIARYTANFTTPTGPFTNDSNTLLLLHMDGEDASTTFTDDNTSGRSQTSLVGLGTADIDTAQSKFGGASFYVDGTGGDGVLAYLPSNPKAFTLEGWYKFDGVPSSKSCMFAHNRPSTGYGNGEWFVTYNYVLNDWSLNIKDNSGTTVTRINSTANDHEDTNWHHLAVCMEIGGYARMFIDGTLEEEVDISGYTFTDWTATLNRIWLGHWYSSANNHECYYDEFRISDTVRYTTSFTAPTAPFVNDANTLLLFHADGTNGSQVFRDDNGTGRSACAIEAVNQAETSIDQSKFGGASFFGDGTDDCLMVHAPGHFDFGTGDFTWEAFVRYDSTASTNMKIIDFRRGGTNGTGETVFDLSSYKLRYFVGGVGNAILGSTVLSQDTWYHVALVRNSGTTTIYLDGTSEGTYTDTQNYNNTSSANGYGATISIGANNVGTAQEWNGYIDEVRISNTARYTSGFTAPTEQFQNDANTLLLLHMDGTDGSTVFIDDNGKHPPA